MPASASFSSIVRAAPGWAKTLNLVPALPYPHEGVSTRIELIRSSTRSSRERARVSGKMEHLLKDQVEASLRLDSELHHRCHLFLPAPGFAVSRHPPFASLEIVDLYVCEQVASIHIDGVVRAAGLAQGAQHLGPDILVAPPVF